MSEANVDSEGAQHAWRKIALDDYERHMADPKVGQLQQLREITGQQVRAYDARRIGVLGVAGGTASTRSTREASRPSMATTSTRATSKPAWPATGISSAIAST